MPELRPGDILLTRSPGIIGALIRYGERVRYSGWPASLAWAARRTVGVARPDSRDDPWWVNHAAVYVGDGQIIEALAAGLTISPAAKYDPSRLVVVPLAQLRPDVTDTDRARAVAYAHRQLAAHDRYGWLSIASIVLQLVTPLRLDLSYDGALICSAFAGYCLMTAGVVLPTLSALTTMPADLAHMALASAVPTIQGARS